MQLGRVVGTVWATKKDEKLESLKLLLVEEVDHHNRALDRYTVAVDAVGAGVGELVLTASGSAARQTILTDGRPADAVVMAIVDSWDIEGRVMFRKHGEAD